MFRSRDKCFRIRRRKNMKKFYFIFALISLLLVFSMGAAAQNSSRVKAKPYPTNRGYNDNLISNKMNRKGQKSSAVFEPNDEPLWAKSRVKKNNRTETVDNNETITIHRRNQRSKVWDDTDITHLTVPINSENDTFNFKKVKNNKLKLKRP